MRVWPKCGSTYCQENFLTACDEFKEDFIGEDRGRRLYQNSFPHPEKKKIKARGDRRSRFPSCLLGKCKDSMTLSG